MCISHAQKSITSYSWVCVSFQVCTQLVRPLLAMSHLLQRQAEQLGALLVHKDAEIQDYKENGATLSRGTRTHTHTHLPCRHLDTHTVAVFRDVSSFGCLCLNTERLQTDVFEEQTYREEFMAKVRGHSLTVTHTHTHSCRVASIRRRLNLLWRCRAAISYCQPIRAGRGSYVFCMRK